MDISIFTPSALHRRDHGAGDRRGAATFGSMEYLDDGPRRTLTYACRWRELIVDFFDQLKSRTQGYASLDYSFAELPSGDLVKLDILVNGAAGRRAVADHAQRQGAAAGARAGREAAKT